MDHAEGLDSRHMFDLHQVSVGTVIQVSADQAYVLQGKALVTICACVVMYIYIYRYSMCSDASLSRCLSVCERETHHYTSVLDWQDQVAKVGADLTQARWSLKIHAHCACVCVCVRARARACVLVTPCLFRTLQTMPTRWIQRLAGQTGVPSRPLVAFNCLLQCRTALSPALMSPRRLRSAQQIYKTC